MGLTTVGTEALRSFTLNDVPLHFVTVCPHCSTRLRIKSVYKSQSVRCKRCNDKFWAEEADGPHTTNSNESGVVQLAQAPPKEDRIVVTCPGCTATLRVRQSHVGHRVACKRCTHVFIGTWPTESALDPGLAGSPATTTPGASLWKARAITSSRTRDLRHFRLSASGFWLRISSLKPGSSN